MKLLCPFCRCELKVVKGRLVGHQFRISFPKTTIGRSEKCDVSLADPYVSRIHCELIYKEGKLELFDLDSLGGTQLNGLTVNRAILLPNDVVKVGKTRLLLDCRISLLQPLCQLFHQLISKKRGII